MTNDIDYKISVMTAFKNGERIESKRKDHVLWVEQYVPLWNWTDVDYRIAKPEPKKVKLCAFIDDNGYLRWIREELFDFAPFTRVHSEDKEITL